MEAPPKLSSAPLECRYPLLGLLQRSLLSDERLLKGLELEELPLDLNIDIAEPLDPLLRATFSAAILGGLFPVRGGMGREQSAAEEHQTGESPVERSAGGELKS